MMTGGVEPSHVRGPPDGVVEIIPLEEEGATRRVGGRARRGEEDDAGAVVPAELASARLVERREDGKHVVHINKPRQVII